MRKIIQRRSEQVWGELVARQISSGLSVQAFCQREGINAWSLYGWRSRLRGKSGATVPVVSPSAGAQRGAEFIDLGALGARGSRCEIRLDLGGGVVLQLVRG